jgi:uncharacterized protein (DUF427 family)
MLYINTCYPSATTHLSMVNAMTAPPVRLPGPEHPIAIRPNAKRVRVSIGGRIVADTRNALTLQETQYPPVQYIPREDVDMSSSERTSHASYCPYKGEASYYSFPIGGARSTNAAWSYESPHAAVAQIKDHLAFYPDRVGAIEELAQ